MSSFNYLGIGEALYVREKCDSLKKFTSKATFTTTSSKDFYIINYENSIIGKQLLSGVNDSYTGLVAAVNSSLTFRFALFEVIEDGIRIIYLLSQIAGEYKKCNYSSVDLQLYIPSVASKEVNDHLKSHVKGADEFANLLKSNENLNKLYNQLKAK